MKLISVQYHIEKQSKEISLKKAHGIEIVLDKKDQILYFTRLYKVNSYMSELRKTNPKFRYRFVKTMVYRGEWYR